MGVRPIDMVMMPQMPEVSNQKQREQTARPIAEQANAQVLVQKEVDVKTHQVTSKDNADNKHQKRMPRMRLTISIRARIRRQVLLMARSQQSQRMAQAMIMGMAEALIYLSRQP